MSKNWSKLKKQYTEDFWKEHGYLHCECCGRNDRPLDWHHLIFRSHEFNNPHKRENVALVCTTCHSEAHSYEGKGYEWCQQQILTRGLK